MDTKNNLVGELARLPNDELVRIEIVYDGGKAGLRRVEGDPDCDDFRRSREQTRRTERQCDRVQKKGELSVSPS
jgi:hypothetical protein